jgi:hypothetical protein
VWLVGHHRFVAKFLCTCGVIVRTGGAIPNPNEWHLISDDGHDPELPGSELLSLSILAWRCAACGRLWLDAGRVKDGKEAETFWEYVPAFHEPGPLAPRDADN